MTSIPGPQENLWSAAVRQNPDHARGYAERWRRIEASGKDIHGEARLIDAMAGRGARILDAGCGTGLTGPQLKALGYSNLAGLDLSDDMLKVAAGRQAYLEKAGDKLDETALSAMMDAETWLTAEQCIQYGLADRYADADADMSGAAAVLQRANLTLEQRLTVQKSLAAQLRQLAQPPAPPAPTPEPEATNSVMALFRNF